MSETRFKIIAGTDQGKERTNNEDNFVICPDLTTGSFIMPLQSETILKLGELGSLLVVADGMGGLNAGEVASQIAIETVEDGFSDLDKLRSICLDPKEIEAFMVQVVNDADARIKQHASQYPESAGMGTTIVIAWLIGDVSYFCWCGDSRAYIYNKNADIKLERVTKDHSYVQQLVDSGNLTEEEAFDFPESNIITRSLGDFQGGPCPDCNFRNVTKGDIILLCSDGLCGLCRDNEIRECLDKYDGNFFNLKNRLIQLALDAGGYDNITIGLLEILDNGNENKRLDINTHTDPEGELKAIRSAKGSKLFYTIAFFLFIVISLFAIKIFAPERFTNKVNENPVCNNKTENIEQQKDCSVVNNIPDTSKNEIIK